MSGIDMLVVYGIKQCDTCRRARKWLGAHEVPYRFHDFRADGLEPALLRAWLSSSFAEQLVNRRSLTWRQLNASQRAAEGESLVQLLLAFPTLIKRPVMVDSEILSVGFKPQLFEDL